VGTVLNLGTLGADALSFWVRASAATTIRKAGFGITSDQRVQYEGEGHIGFPVTTTWTQVLIPIPSNAGGYFGNIFTLATNADAAGKTIYLDDIQYVKMASYSLDSIEISATAGPIQYGVATACSALTGDKSATWKLNDRYVTLFDYNDWEQEGVAVNTFSEWFTFAYNLVGGSATLTAGNLTPTAPSSTATFNLSFGGKNSNNCVVSIAADTSTFVIDNFSDLAVAADFNVGTRWYDPKPQVTGAIIASNRPGSEAGKSLRVNFNGARDWPGGAGDSAKPFNLTGYTNVTFWVNVLTGTAPQMRMVMAVGPGAPNEESVNFTIPAPQNQWRKITIPLTSWTRGAARTAWIIASNGGAADTFSIAIEQIQLEK
jgi:hypothetical protein